MKALVYLGAGQIELREEPHPIGAVVVKVRQAGICGTDLKAYQRGHHLFAPPMILGHECYGIIQESSLENFHEGEVVAVAPYYECGKCWKCEANIGELCEEKMFLKTGCFSEYLGIMANEIPLLFKLEEDHESFVLAEPLACVINGIEKLKHIHRPLVVGGGPIGALFAVYLALREHKVVVVEPSQWRSLYLQRLGLDVEPPDKLGNGRRYDPVIICVDKPELVEQYLPQVCDGGELLLFAGFPRGTQVYINPFHIHYREVQVVGSFGYMSVHFSQALQELAQHKEAYRRVITHRFPLEAYAEAFSLLGSGEALKVVFEIS